jgi:hypothetical protein
MDIKIPCTSECFNYSTHFIPHYKIYTYQTCLLAYPTELSIPIPSPAVVSSALAHFSHQLASTESFLPLLGYLHFPVISEMLKAYRLKMDALELRLKISVAERKWNELSDVKKEVEDMRKEFVKEEGYTEYLLRKEMLELNRQRKLEGRISKGYIEKVRQVDDLAHKIKQNFDVTMQKKVEELEHNHSEKTADIEKEHSKKTVQLKKTHREEKTSIRNQLQRQHQAELKRINDKNDEKFEELKTEFAKLDSENKDLKEKLSEMKEAKLSFKPLISYETFNALYKGIMDSDIDLSSGSDIFIDTRKQESKKLLKEIAKIKMPKFCKLYLNYIEKKDEIVNDFMLSLQVESLEKFLF